MLLLVQEQAYMLLLSCACSLSVALLPRDSSPDCCLLLQPLPLLLHVPSINKCDASSCNACIGWHRFPPLRAGGTPSATPRPCQQRRPRDLLADAARSCALLGRASREGGACPLLQLLQGEKSRREEKSGGGPGSRCCIRWDVRLFAMLPTPGQTAAAKELVHGPPTPFPTPSGILPAPAARRSRRAGPAQQPPCAAAVPPGRQTRYRRLE